jgi:hypothetical protein
MQQHVAAAAAARSSSSSSIQQQLRKVYDGEPLQVLFKFSGAQATRRISREQLPFWSQYLFYFKFAV